MVTLTSELAVQVLVFLARKSAGQPLTPGVIAAALHASPTYVAKICGNLSRAGILRSTRGAKGGVSLLAKPQGLTLLQIIEASQGKLLADYCSPSINLEHVCNWHRAMDELHTSVIGVLGRWTLADILRCPFPSGPTGDDAHCRIAKTEFDWGDRTSSG
jgi:Rrf2 family nitric oxide-sensitive transcriptional repressor